MAKLALTVVGMGIGFAIGGPFGAQIGAMIGGMVGNILFAPTVKGPRLTDLTVTASTYGQVIPELYGTMRLGGNMIWTAGIKEHKHKSGGKGGPKQRNLHLYRVVRYRFLQGSGRRNYAHLGRWQTHCWQRSEEGERCGEILSMFGILNLTKKSKGKFKYKFYVGDENQGPDATIVADKGTGNVPGYRGLAYLVFVDMPLDDFGNRTPQITAEITRNPVSSAPYVNFGSNTTTYSDPGAGWHTGGTPDWVNNQFYKYDNGYFIDYDMRTMQELVRFPVQGATGVPFAPQLPHNAVPCFSVGGGYFFDVCGFGNSSAYGLWDGKTGAFLTHVGINSNATHEDPMGDHDQPFNPDTAKVGADGTAMWFRVLTLTGQEDFVYHAGVIDSWFTIWTASLKPAHYTEVPFGTSAHTWTPMRGRENPPSLTGLGNSDFLLTTVSTTPTAHWDVHLKIINILEMTQMILPVGPPWDATNFPLTTETDIQLPRPFAGEKTSSWITAPTMRRTTAS
jgi:hypothetical protein